MRRHTFLNLATIAIVLSAVMLVGSCSTSGPEGERLENQPPTVWLSSAPPEGTTEKYTIHLYWGGWDPDGEIAYYEYAITNNGGGSFVEADTTGRDKWNKVVSNDSTFTFSADSLVETNPTSQKAEFQRSHTFFIRAVDKQGLSSREPAYRSFTARTISPTVSIRIPLRNNLNAAQVPPISTFRWKATDYIFDDVSSQEPDSVQWALVSLEPFDSRTSRSAWDEALDFMRKAPYIFNTGPTGYGDFLSPADADAQWKPWVFYRANGDTGKFWITPLIDYGDYLFVIRAKDEAGAVTPVLDLVTNVRRVTVSARNSGPSLTVTNSYMGAAGAGRCSTPPTIMDIPAGVPLDFQFNASAAAYGGEVAAFRYGWDIDDLEDPEQWEIDYSPYLGPTSSASRTFYFGTHSFCVEVLDNSGFCSRLCVRVNIIPFTMERPLLLVDDWLTDKNVTAGWTNTTGKAYAPTDKEHDSFWSRMLFDVEGFDADEFDFLGNRTKFGEDVIEVVAGADVSLLKLATYKSIIWSVSSNIGASQLNQPLLYEFVQHRERYPQPNAGASSGGKVRPNILALFVAAGGHLFINGEHPVATTVNRDLIGSFRIPIMLLYELEGRQDRAPVTNAPIGDRSFNYRELCVDVLDYARMSFQRRRRKPEEVCDILGLRTFTADTENPRVHTLRSASPLDDVGAILDDEFVWPQLDLNIECSGPGKFYNESKIGHDVEIYNPQYFFDKCPYVKGSRGCFQPIYSLECLDATENTYHQPVAFWTSAYADRVSEAAGAIAARSVVWGFSPVYFEESAVKQAIDNVIFGEWKLEKEDDS